MPLSHRAIYSSHRLDFDRLINAGGTIAVGAAPDPDSRPDITPEEAAVILDVSRATIYRRIREGKLPHHGYRFTAADLNKLLTEPYRPSGTSR